MSEETKRTEQTKQAKKILIVSPLLSLNHCDNLEGDSLMLRTRTIRTFTKLIESLSADLSGQTEPVWFRGHGKSSWKLAPGYHRIKKPIHEVSQINQFRQNANLLVNQTPKSDFDWLFLMQHYGVPTRLLDWTESPLIALYFAVTECPKAEGAVWILKPFDLNRETTEKPEEIKYIPSFEDEILEAYSTKSVTQHNVKGMNPMAVIATRNNVRIQAQMGVFTISHSSKPTIEEIGDNTHVIKYIIPAAAKPKLKQVLTVLRMTKFQVFPELASIGELLRQQTA